jgi:UDP-GlcNAc:undecaprenyl-phosphate GlcNAc-1-phosphate transferase
MLPKHVRYQTALHPVDSPRTAKTAEIMAGPAACQPTGGALPCDPMPALPLPALAVAAATMTWAAAAALERACPPALRDASPHAAGKPRIGGLAILLGALAVTPFAPGATPFLLPIAAATLLGVHDDATDSPAPLRLVALVAIATLAASLGSSPLPLPLVILWLVAVTVGFDFIDGLDGLASTLALVALLPAAVLAPAPWLVAVTAAVCIYLVVSNRPPARSLLGDGGSNGLGMAAGLAVLHGAGAGGARALPLALLVALPLLDLATTVLRRGRSGRGLFAGERGHMHHRLQELWGSAPPAVAEMAFVGVVCAAAGALAFQEPAALGRCLIASGIALSLLLWRTRATRPAPTDSR